MTQPPSMTVVARPYHQQGIHPNRADDLLRQRNLFDKQVVPHMNPFAPSLKEPNCAYRPSQPGKSINGVSSLR
jgi:hypothetical protein